MDGARLLQAHAVDAVREGVARRDEPAGRLGRASARAEDSHLGAPTHRVASAGAHTVESEATDGHPTAWQQQVQPTIASVVLVGRQLYLGGRGHDEDAYQPRPQSHAVAVGVDHEAAGHKFARGREQRLIEEGISLLIDPAIDTGDGYWRRGRAAVSALLKLVALTVDSVHMTHSGK